MAPDDSGSGTALKLRVEDADDLVVLSACLQDALVPVRDLAYLREDGSFVLVANRFRWEDGIRPLSGETGHQRTLCAVAFSEVLGVTYRGFRRSDDDRILSLLAIRAEPDGGSRKIRLEFSGGASVRLEVAGICGRAKDFGEPWPTPWQPRHETQEQS
jgi:hypothetical protein